MNDWRELKTLQEVAEAQRNGEEIEVHSITTWIKFDGKEWYADCLYRSRPKRKTKLIVLRTALINNSFTVTGTEEWIKKTYTNPDYYKNAIHWLDTPERIVEVEEND